jgi:peptidoglycan/xylan/chitin deacetylase (PgdA/CDA1 family)
VLTGISKRIIERALVFGGVTAFGRYRRRRDILVLAYHNVLRADERSSGERSLHLPWRQFVRQLDALERGHHVVPLTGVLEDRTSARRPNVVITFDDAYRGAVAVAAPELARRGMPATIFVAPGLLGRYTWWDQLADSRTGRVPAATRDRALAEYAGDGAAILRALRTSEVRPDGDAPRIATEDELFAAAAIPGITFGSHTWTHANLSVLPAPDVDRELRSSLEWLRARFTCSIPWLSYPYGLYTEQVKRAAESAGFVGSMRVDGGWIGSALARAPQALPRYNVPAGLSIHGFRLRLAGWGAGAA